MPYFVGKILELPLTTIQDYSLFHILGDYSINLWKQQIDIIREKNGLASFITHPDYLTEPPSDLPPGEYIIVVTVTYTNGDIRGYTEQGFHVIVR